MEQHHRSDDELLGRLHLEIHESDTPGDRAHLLCWCAIGRGHTYADWVEADGPPRNGRPWADRSG